MQEDLDSIMNSTVIFDDLAVNATTEENLELDVSDYLGYKISKYCICTF